MRYGFIGLAASLALAGCSLVQTDTQAPPPLTQPAFESRINGLEDRLASQCDPAEVLQRQRRHQQDLTADVREVGSLLRGLRSDMASRQEDRDDKQVVVDKACKADDILGTKTLLGRSEWVGLPKLETYLQARIDSGAKTASLSAREITAFERDGDDWVRFKLALQDDDEVVDARRDAWIEAPVERKVRIIQASGKETRPVISLLTTLGPIRQKVDFTLNDRSHLDYPVLLGRRFLLDIALVDVAQRYIHDRPSFARDDDDSPDSDDSSSNNKSPDDNATGEDEGSS